MAIVKMIPTKSAHNLIHYMLDGKAHNNEFTNERNLFIGGHNIFADYAGKANADYIDSQFYAVREIAGKKHKKTQAFHNIYSFSDEDFPPPKDDDEMKKQAKQAYKLVMGFLDEQLPKDAEFLVTIQRDGEGGKLHAHCCINSVLINGKVLDTNNLSLVNKITVKQKDKVKTKTKTAGLYERMQNYFASKFEGLTGRKYQKIERDLVNNVHASAQQIEDRQGYSWKEDLKQRIADACQDSTSLDEFKQTLADSYGVDVKEYQSSTGKIDAQNKKITRTAYTYSFVDDEGKKRKSRDFHYTKKGALRGLGTFARPQDLQVVLAQNLQQRKQAEQQEIQQLAKEYNSDDLTKVEVFQNGKTGQSFNDEQQSQSINTTTTGTTNFGKVKHVKVSERAEDYDTTEYDAETDKQNRINQQEAIRIAVEQQQRKRREAERKRKQREQELAKREQQRIEQSNQDYGRSQTTNNTPEPTRNSESIARGYESNPPELE